MEALILDENYDTVAILDTFQSFIWVDRYRSYGDFEVYLPAGHPLREYFKMGYYLMLNGSDRMMIIETIEIDTDVEDGDKLTVTGRSLESILDRRIIWGRKTLSGNLQLGIKELLDENAINPENTNRKIPRLTFRASTDSRITILAVDVQLEGENLYEVICTLCEDNGIGFRVLPDFDNMGLIFELYVGENHTYSQDNLPWIVFSPKYENLMSTNYIESNVDYRNVALVSGADDKAISNDQIDQIFDGEMVDDTGKTWAISGNKEVSGLKRRELYVNATGTYREYHDPDTDEVIQITDEEYEQQLISKGDEALSGKKETASFYGEAVQTAQFQFGEDFFLGDLVQIDNGYGKELEVTITEVTFSCDESGEIVTPTFTALEDTQTQIIL